MLFFLFFFNDTATTEIYTLSLHDALPICVFKEKEDSMTNSASAIPEEIYYHFAKKSQTVDEIGRAHV